MVKTAIPEPRFTAIPFVIQKPNPRGSWQPVVGIQFAVHITACKGGSAFRPGLGRRLVLPAEGRIIGTVRAVSM